MPITNEANIINSRDVIDRLRELETGSVMSPEEATEWVALKGLTLACRGLYWAYGETLIRESHFIDFTRGAIGGLPPSPFCCVERVAEKLKMYFTEVDFAGVTYLIRAD